MCDEDVVEGDYRSGDVEEELESTEQEGETPATPTGMFHFKFANQAVAQNSKGHTHPNAPPNLQTSNQAMFLQTAAPGGHQQQMMFANHNNKR